MTEAQLRKRHGWSKTSNMPARYVHLINQDVEDALLKHYGIKKDDAKIQQELPIKCVICEMLNPPKTSNCTKCGKPLSVEAAIEAEEKSNTKLEEMEQMILEIDSKRQQDQMMHEEKIKQLEKKIIESNS